MRASFSVMMICWPGVAPVPPYTFGQSGAIQPWRESQPRHQLVGRRTIGVPAHRGSAAPPHLGAERGFLRQIVTKHAGLTLSNAYAQDRDLGLRMSLHLDVRRLDHLAPFRP